MAKDRFNRFHSGSALILAVFLTSLLAIIGVMFVMIARVDKISTSAISENRELNFAVDTVIAKISQELVLDTPGVAGREYYDYPGTEDKWLASLEPYKAGSNYKWRQISDVTGFLADNSYDTGEVDVDPPGVGKYIPDYPEITLDAGGELEQLWADADGDGVADSKWVELDDITSGKGKPIYAAIRIVDNGAMLNVNTAYQFDANDTDADLIDGSNQTQIDLLALSRRSASNSIDDLDDMRYGSQSPRVLDDYIRDVVWRYYSPPSDTGYTPFDISDELELRNRFLLNHPDIDSRIEEVWDHAFQWPNPNFPIGTATLTLDGWFNKVQYDVSEPNATDNYSYRHIGTTYNIDRIIDPVGEKMINVNGFDTSSGEYAGSLYDKLLDSVADANLTINDQTRERFAQFAVNLADFIDDDTDVTAFEPNDPSNPKDTYYGFDAQPFITEIAMKIDIFPESKRNYFAVELYNPFDVNIPLEDFELVIVDSNDPCDTSGTTIDFTGGESIGKNSYFVIVNQKGEFNIYNESDENTKEDGDLEFFDNNWKPPIVARPPVTGRPGARDNIDRPRVYIGWPKDKSDVLLLRRKADSAEIYVDKQIIDPNWAPAGQEQYFGRDERSWHVVYQTMEEDNSSNGSLGQENDIEPDKFADRGHNFSFFLPNPVNPAGRFVTAGDIPRILTIGPDIDPGHTIGQKLGGTDKDQEARIRLNLQSPYHRNIFRYLTALDPTTDGIDNDGDNSGEGIEQDDDELKIPGRININTAPWYVIAQLPWINGPTAKAIIDYRDRLGDYSNRYDAIKDITDNPVSSDQIREDLGFASIGELNLVIAGDNDESMSYYILGAEENDDLDSFPDLTRGGTNQGDDIADDFEERDVIFARISNLAAVRSDVFTAYILIRIGTDGPQRRVVAILDRSDVDSDGGNVRIVALHRVPDPR